VTSENNNNAKIGFHNVIFCDAGVYILGFLIPSFSISSEMQN